MVNMKYAGFWRRLLAVLIDTLVLMPFIALFLWLDSLSRTVAIAIAIPTAVLFWAYDFYLHGRYGQTVGKMVARIQVRRLDGSPIGWREAFLRSSVDFAFAVILTVGGVYGLCGVSAYEYEHIGWLKLNEYLAAFRPVYYEPVDKMQSVWFLSEVVVLLFNRKKRALHDFIAGTVVAHKASIPDTLPVKADDEVEVLEPRTGRKGTLKNLALAVGLGLFLNIGLQPTMVHWGGLIRGEQSVVLGVIAVAAMFIGYSARYWVAGLSAGLLSTRRRPLWNITGGVVLVVGMLAFFAVRHALAWAFTPEENTPRFRPFHGPSRSLVGEMTLRLLYEDPRYIDTSWSSLWPIIKTELLYGATGIVFGLILHPAVLLVRRVHANPRGRIALYGTTSVTALAIVIFLSIPSREKVTGMAPKVVIEFHLVKPEAMTAVPTGLPSDLAKLLEEGSLTVTVRVRSDGPPAPPSSAAAQNRYSRHRVCQSHDSW